MKIYTHTYFTRLGFDTARRGTVKRFHLRNGQVSTGTMKAMYFAKKHELAHNSIPFLSPLCDDDSLPSQYLQQISVFNEAIVQRYLDYGTCTAAGQKLPLSPAGASQSEVEPRRVLSVLCPITCLQLTYYT